MHDFRRTAVRKLERTGVPRSVATKLTGHRTEAVYRRYAIVSDADLRAASAKLAGMGHNFGHSSRSEHQGAWYKLASLRHRGVAQPGSAPDWGSGGRWFKSSRPDHFPRCERAPDRVPVPFPPEVEWPSCS
jgi:hypothetical protein